jgi:hypothetical protein
MMKCSELFKKLSALYEQTRDLLVIQQKKIDMEV